MYKQRKHLFERLQDWFYNIAFTIISICLILLIIHIYTNIYKYYSPKQTTILTITSSFPTKGTILYYEDFRGYRVPIKADGQGGTYRWIADVPWRMFTIEEKFDMARVGGGWLAQADIDEIKQKYGAR